MRTAIVLSFAAVVAVLAAGCVSAEERKVEKIGSGYQFTEGPVWAPWGSLLFSDIPANRIYEVKGEARVYRAPSGQSNGLTFDQQGRLLACEHLTRRVTRTEKDGSLTVLAERYEGKRLNSPNDAVVKSDGSIYFTDPPYGVAGDKRELNFQGVYRITPNGKLELLVKDFDMPNGLCFSPDEKRLYIADSSNLRHIRVFDVAADGALANGRVFAKLAEGGVPDGMKVDVTGNLYSSGPGGVWVFDASGKHLETIGCPEVPANLCWGDEDGKGLYITARTGVYKVRLDTRGVLPGRVKRGK